MEHYSNNDLGWQEGMSDWLPLSKFLGAKPNKAYKIPNGARKSSGYSRTSFYIGVGSFCLWLLVYMPIAAMIRPEEASESPLMQVVRVLMFGSSAANLSGIIFSFLAYVNPYSSKLKASYGLFFNITVFVMTLAILGRGWIFL